MKSSWRKHFQCPKNRVWSSKPIHSFAPSSKEASKSNFTNKSIDSSVNVSKAGPRTQCIQCYFLRRWPKKYRRHQSLDYGRNALRYQAGDGFWSSNIDLINSQPLRRNAYTKIDSEIARKEGRKKLALLAQILSFLKHVCHRSKPNIYFQYSCLNLNLSY